MASLLSYFRVFSQPKRCANNAYRWISTKQSLLAQPPQGRAHAEHVHGVLKGSGNPMIMRRLINGDEDDSDEDDDFLTDAGKPSGASDASAGATPKKRTKGVTRNPTQPNNTRVHTAEYISSSTKLERCPQDGRPEFAIIGRSNVGKSSLINMLTRSKNLALTSKQPGNPS